MILHGSTEGEHVNHTHLILWVNLLLVPSRPVCQIDRDYLDLILQTLDKRRETAKDSIFFSALDTKRTASAN